MQSHRTTPLSKCPELKCLFFAEFNNTLGPVITCQVPHDLIRKDLFDKISSLIIPKEELLNKLVKVTVDQYRILGVPMGIQNQKYERNKFLFNMCFVVENSKEDTAEATTSALSDYVPFEPIVKKLAGYLRSLEIESGFLLDDVQKRKRLTEIMSLIVQELNATGVCEIPINQSTTIYLQITPPRCDPPTVSDDLVPVLMTPIAHGSIEWEQFDAVTRRILSLIDGRQHLSRIIREIDIDPSLVRHVSRVLALPE